MKSGMATTRRVTTIHATGQAQDLLYVPNQAIRTLDGQQVARFIAHGDEAQPGIGDEEAPRPVRGQAHGLAEALGIGAQGHGHGDRHLGGQDLGAAGDHRHDPQHA